MSSLYASLPSLLRSLCSLIMKGAKRKRSDWSDEGSGCDTALSRCFRLFLRHFPSLSRRVTTAPGLLHSLSLYVRHSWSKTEGMRWEWREMRHEGSAGYGFLTCHCTTLRVSSPPHSRNFLGSSSYSLFTLSLRFARCHSVRDVRSEREWHRADPPYLRGYSRILSMLHVQPRRSSVPPQPLRGVSGGCRGWTWIECRGLGLPCPHDPPFPYPININ